MWSLGIDTGGALTDIVVRDAERTLARKVLTSAFGLLFALARAGRVVAAAEPLGAIDWAGFEAPYRRLEAECRMASGLVEE